MREFLHTFICLSVIKSLLHGLTCSILQSFVIAYCLLARLSGWQRKVTLRDFLFDLYQIKFPCLIVMVACRRTGIDAYILGLGASVGVMVWTGTEIFYLTPVDSKIVTLEVYIQVKLKCSLSDVSLKCLESFWMFKIYISPVRFTRSSRSDTGISVDDAWKDNTCWSKCLPLCTGERCLVKREGSPAGIVALFAASMAVMFTAALYHTFWVHGATGCLSHWMQSTIQQSALYLWIDSGRATRVPDFQTNEEKAHQSYIHLCVSYLLNTLQV